MPRQSLPFDPVEEARRQWKAHGWDEAAPGMTAVTSMMRAQQILLARIDAELRPFGLTFARYELLMLLSFSRAGRLPLATISRRLQVHPTSVTSAVDRLEAQGLVRRAPHPTDRRTKLVVLDPAGEEVAAQATEVLNKRVFTDTWLPEGRIEDLVDILRDLRVEAGDFAPDTSDDI